MKEGKELTNSELLQRIAELESRLEESEHMIDAIKAGEVDAFAIDINGQSEIYTLQSADYTYRLLLEEFGEGAVNVTEEGMIVYTNPAFSEMLHLPYEKVIGASIFDFVHADSQVEFEELFKKSMTGKSKGEINLRVRETVITTYASLTSLRPKLNTIGIIFTDFTEKKSTEKIIKDYQSSLESKNKELLRNNEELTSFAYIASHDMQEPLRKIQIFSSRLLENDNDRISETGQDNLDRIIGAVKRMQNLIDDLLIYSRTNTVERKFEKINLGVVIAEVKEDMKEDMEEKHAVIETIEMCEVRVIHFQFRQLFYNLISNSLKFSTPDQAPHIKIKSELASGSSLGYEKLSPQTLYCHISVSDNGIGFEPQYSERIFKVFTRLHGRAEYPGTGIGLSIVKKIVENHDGFIIASAEVGSGATFDIYIPED